MDGVVLMKFAIRNFHILSWPFWHIIYRICYFIENVAHTKINLLNRFQSSMVSGVIFAISGITGRHSCAWSIMKKDDNLDRSSDKAHRFHVQRCILTAEGIRRYPCNKSFDPLLCYVTYFRYHWRRFISDLKPLKQYARSIICMLWQYQALLITLFWSRNVLSVTGCIGVKLPYRFICRFNWNSCNHNIWFNNCKQWMTKGFNPNCVWKSLLFMTAHPT